MLRSTVRRDEITSERKPDMIVDCDRCAVRGDACQDCVITVLLGAPPEGVELDRTERWALDTLADAGMVPRLQLVDCPKDGGAKSAVAVAGISVTRRPTVTAATVAETAGRRPPGRLRSPESSTSDFG